MTINNVVGKYKQDGRFWYTRNVNTITKLTVHHTASRFDGTPDEILNALKNIHINKDWVGLSYHYIILKDGSIYQINSHNEVTWHDGSNWDSLGICVHGYFHPQYNEKPTDAQLKSLSWLLNKLCTEHPEFPADFDDVRGHREVMSTACPGNELFPYVEDFRNTSGKVTWGEISVDNILNMVVPVENFEGKLKTVRFYFNEWEVEKKARLKLLKEYEQAIDEKDKSFAELQILHDDLAKLYKNLLENDKVEDKEHQKLVDNYQEITQKLKELSDDLIKEKKKVEPLKERILLLEQELSRYQNKKYTLTEAIEHLIRALFG